MAAAIPVLQLFVGSGILLLMLRIAYIMGGYTRSFTEVQRTVAEMKRELERLDTRTARIDRTTTTLKAVSRLIAPRESRPQVEALLNTPAYDLDPVDD